MKSLVRLSLRMRAVTLLVVTLLVAVGSYAVVSLKQELFPSLEAPVLVVTAAQPGASPEQVADDVTAPIEEAVRGTSGLDTVTSTTVEGSTFVVAQYEFGTDMAQRADDLRSGLDAAGLPQGVAAPSVEQINPDSFPVYSVAVAGEDEQVLNRYVARDLEPAVAGAPGVGEVTTSGTGAEVVAVTLDPDALSEAGVTAGDVTAALQAANLSTPVGGVVADGVQLPVRVATGTDDLAAVQDVPVRSQATAPGAAPVPLSQLADVRLTDSGSGATISRTDGEPSVNLSVVKDQDANTVDVVQEVKDAIASTPEPDGVDVNEVLDQAPLITQGISELARDALLGVALAIVVILLFLRSWRGTIVTGISIPLSLLVAFVLMRIDGISLNILTIGALSVAAGRVIDDSIVVFENIHRLLEKGYERGRAVLEGTTQMVPAITASTLTTVAVFLPLGLAGGLVGSVFLGFALTVTFALLASLLVAVTVIPVLASLLVKEEQSSQHVRETEPLLQRIYRRPLDWALGHRFLTVGAAVVVLVAAVSSLAGVGTNLFPASQVTQLQVSLRAEAGSSLQATADRVAEVEAALADSEEVEQYTTVVGSTGEGVAALANGGGGSSTATIDVLLAEDADDEEVTDVVDDAVARAGLSGQASPVGGSPTTSQASVVVTGSDFADVSATATELTTALEGESTLDDVANNIATERPELVVAVDTAAATAAGVDPSAVAALLQTSLTPVPATTVTLDGQQREVVVAVDPAALSGPQAIAALPLAGGLTVGDVATVGTEPGAAAVTRSDGARSAEVTATIVGEDTGAASAAVQEAVDALDVPAGVEVSTGGAGDLQGDSFSSLLLAMLVAVALVYLVMVVTFGTLLTPLVILLTLPLAAIGAFPALLVTGRSLDLPAMLGVLMLIGIVVTNAIVLLERVERLRRAGMPTTAALKDAGHTRLRPILMTAIVTMMALAPLALGLSEGALLSASLATVVIGGLFSSTLLTLLVVPAVYSLLDGMRQRVLPGSRPGAVGRDERSEDDAVDRELAGIAGG